MTNVVNTITKLKKLIIKDYLTKDTSIFLCGGASKEQSQIRFRLGKFIEIINSKYSYSIFYPETLFTEILLGHNKTDLLSLENFLAESVNAVVLPLQSAGTFTELGAFCNHPKLKDKLIVIIDPQYKLDNSFINSGPIKFLRNNSKSIIIYSKLTEENISKISQKITKAARDIKQHNPLEPSIENPLISKLFYLSIIYIFDPIDRDLLNSILCYLIPKDKNNSIKDTIMTSILKEKNIRLVNNKLFSFKEHGFDIYLRKIGYTQKDIVTLLDKLSEFRIEVINFYYRKKGIYFGGRNYRLRQFS